MLKPYWKRGHGTQSLRLFYMKNGACVGSITNFTGEAYAYAGDAWCTTESTGRIPKREAKLLVQRINRTPDEVIARAVERHCVHANRPIVTGWRWMSTTRVRLSGTYNDHLTEATGKNRMATARAAARKIREATK